MTKSYIEESIREEAERHDVLDERGTLDDLPFTPLRRYAKDPSQVYAIRIPISRLTAIRRLASRRKEQPTALLREWVLERLDQELSTVEHGLAYEYPSVGEPARGYEGKPATRVTATKKRPSKTPGAVRSAAGKKDRGKKLRESTTRRRSP